MKVVATVRAWPLPTVAANFVCPCFIWNTRISMLRYHGFPFAVSPCRMMGFGFLMSCICADDVTVPPAAVRLVFNVNVEDGSVKLNIPPGVESPLANETL